MVAADDVAPPGQHHRLGLVVDPLAALLCRQWHERSGIIEHQLAHQLVRALAHAEDIQEPPRLQLGHSLGADHAAIGDHAHARDVEAPAQPVDHRDQRRHVGGVAGPHLRAHRPAIAIDQDSEDHLPQVGTVILAVAVLAQRLAACALEVEAGGVHEHQVEPREQVAPIREQPLLHHVLPGCSTSNHPTLERRTGDHAMKRIITKSDSSQPVIETAVYLFDDWFDPIEAGVRDQVRGFIQAMIEVSWMRR